MNFIDLFCGIGGFSLGFKQAGIDHLFGVDNWGKSCMVYERYVGNVMNVKVEDFHYQGITDVLIGSPPCQSFSKANLHSRICDLSLSNEFFRIVDEVKPKIWIMENVPDVYELINAPYKYVFDMSEFGIMQNRKRFFGSNIKLNLEKEEYKYYTALQVSKKENFGRGNQIHDLFFEKPEDEIVEEPRSLFATVTGRYNSFSKIDATVKDKNGVRNLSHKEALWIQTFPFYYELTENEFTQREIEQMIGNSVPPAFSFILGKYIKNYLNESITNNENKFF